METRTKRTLVKSPPELWELADDTGRMEGWMAGLIGSPEPVAVEVTARDPERRLAWRAARNGDATMAIELVERGFGTAVSITAEHAGSGDPALALERLLDELGSPERRPFSAA